MIRLSALLALLLTGAAVAQPSHAPPAAEQRFIEPHLEHLPSLLRSMPYEEARRILIDGEWSPIAKPGDTCEPDDNRCTAWPELVACSTGGLRRCTFIWQKGEVLVEVGTFGERPIMDHTWCMEGCRSPAQELIIWGEATVRP